MNCLKKFFTLGVILINLANISLYAQYTSSQSNVDWTKKTFSSTIELDVEKSNIQIPSGRSAGEQIINLRIPVLLKDPVLSLAVDSSKHLGDEVLYESVPLEEITNLMEDSKKTSPHYSQTSTNLIVQHEINMNELSSMLVKHKKEYSPKQNIQKISSRPYTGIIIDARGTLPVQGEFVSAKGKPCFFPRIWNDSMDLVYEKNMEIPEATREYGVVAYHFSTDEHLYADRIGNDPLRITAKKIFGINRTDPVISSKDALRILSVPENRELLRQGRIVILLDKDELIYRATAPEKDESYYVVYRDTENFFYERKIPDVTVKDTYKGIKISVHNLKFVADSNEFLPEEKTRLDALYEELADKTSDNSFSIMVEGHTASVGKPNGEMNLSIERAKTLIDEMVSRGMNRSKFSYKGYGGTVPVGDNDTESGRAQNRRVEIILIPKATYIQRR